MGILIPCDHNHGFNGDMQLPLITSQFDEVAAMTW